MVSPVNTRAQNGVGVLKSMRTVWSSSLTTSMSWKLPSVVAAVAGYGLLGLSRRPRIALGIVLVALCLLDLRFRLVSSGPYMDFKHLSFVGTLVLTLAASAVLRLIWSRSWAAALGAVLALGWVAGALVLDRNDAINQGPQVTASLFQIRDWAARQSCSPSTCTYSDLTRRTGRPGSSADASPTGTKSADGPV